MRSHASTTGLKRALIALLTIGLFCGPAISNAAVPDDLTKNLTKKLSGVQRRIVTQPSQAEKDMIEARKLLAQLKEAVLHHAKLSALQKRADGLAEKLEKRLGHPIGAAPAHKETKPASKPVKAPPPNLPRSVVSRLKRMDTALEAVAAALEKSRLQTAKAKLVEAKKLMDEIQRRYAKNIPPDNEQMADGSAIRGMDRQAHTVCQSPQ